MFGLHIFFCLFFVDCLLLCSATLLRYCALLISPCFITLLFCLIDLPWCSFYFFVLLDSFTTSPCCSPCYIMLLLHLDVLPCFFTLLCCFVASPCCFALLHLFYYFTLLHRFVTLFCYYTLLHCLTTPCYVALFCFDCCFVPWFCWIGFPLPKFVVQVLEWQTSSFSSLSSIIFSPFFL
jgi:hypothetical protein